MAQLTKSWLVGSPQRNTYHEKENVNLSKTVPLAGEDEIEFVLQLTRDNGDIRLLNFKLHDLMDVLPNMLAALDEESLMYCLEKAFAIRSKRRTKF